MSIARKPNLFLVGFPKAGTTTLAAMLRKHSNIYAPPGRELHYFEPKYKNLPYSGPGDMQEAPIKSEAEYLEIFALRTEKYLLDYTPAYIEHPEVAADIATFNRDARILISLRDPTERCFSNYCHQVRNGYETLPFEDALDAEAKRKSDNWGMFWRYKENSYYYERTKVYLDTFLPANVKIVLMDELRTAPTYLAREIIDWLDLENEEISVSEQYNRSGRPNWKLKLMRALRSFPAARSLGRRLVSQDAVRKFMNDNVTRIEIDENTRKQLRELFRSDVMKLQSLIGKDLSAWYD